MQVHQPGDHVEFMVELAYGSVVRVCQARVALEPSDVVLHAHLGGVDQVVVHLLLGSQDPVVLGPLVGDHERGAGQILAGSLIAPVDPERGSCLLPGLSRRAWIRHTYQTASDPP